MCISCIPFFFQELRSPGRQLLIYLSAADLLTASGNFTGIMWYIFRDKMSPSVDWGICQFHAYLTIFSSIVSFLWTICIGIHLNISIVLGKNDFANSCIWGFHIICWSLPGKLTHSSLCLCDCLCLNAISMFQCYWL